MKQLAVLYEHCVKDTDYIERERERQACEIKGLTINLLGTIGLGVSLRSAQQSRSETGLSKVSDPH